MFWFVISSLTDQRTVSVRGIRELFLVMVTIVHLHLVLRLC